MTNSRRALFPIGLAQTQPRIMSTIDGAITSVIAAKQAALRTQVDFAVARKQLDATAAQGQAAVALLDSAAQLSKAVGLGTNFDAQG